MSVCVTIPAFEWIKGRSGQLLQDQQARVLETLWQQFIETNISRVDGKTLNIIKGYTKS